MRNRLQQHAITSQPFKKSRAHRLKASKACDSTFLGWYQLRKRGAQRLRNLSGGQIEIAESGYRGHSEEHWLRHLGCGCLFKASLHDVSHLDADTVCPFCFPEKVESLHRYGSVAALRELVSIMSSGNIDFLATNVLGRPSDDYEFICNIRRCRFTASFNKFAANPEHLCPFCQLTHQFRDRS